MFGVRVSVVRLACVFLVKPQRWVDTETLSLAGAQGSSLPSTATEHFFHKNQNAAHATTTQASQKPHGQLPNTRFQQQICIRRFSLTESMHSLAGRTRCPRKALPTIHVV